MIRTRYEDQEFGVPVPRELWAEATGDAPSLEEGLNAAWGAMSPLLPIIALVTNAATGELQPHLAFEHTNGVEERAFFQSTIEDERGVPLAGRRIPVEATVETLRAMQETSRLRSIARLFRAANQYLMALRYWQRGNELLCVEHLFMAAEALKVLALRKELADSGADEETLARSWKIRPGEPRTRELLEEEARRQLVFYGDANTEKAAEEISDGFEHGYKDFGDLHGPSRNVRDKTAEHVRSAFFELAGLPEVVRSELMSDPYRNPVDMMVLVRYLRGSRIGPGDELAAKDQQYPYLEWTSAPQLKEAGEGHYTMSGTETFTVRTADGIGFKPASFELWGPSGFRKLPSNPGEGDPEPES